MRLGFSSSDKGDSGSSARRQRWISAAEVLVGTFVVFGHNVFHVVPNEVPILVVLLWISSRVREGRWVPKELALPDSWWKTVGWGLAAAVVLQVGSELVVVPLASWLFRSPEHVSSVLLTSAHDWKQALGNLAIVWVFAGFGEEVGYRGYLVGRAAEAGGRSTWAWVGAVVYVAVLFGFGHFYKGPEGILDSTYSGLVLGGVYLISSRNLWAAIMAHGLSDTFAVLWLFMGWAT